MVLRNGGIVIGPTDTVYGIFGDATKKQVIEKIFALKQRPLEKAFPIFVKDIEMARCYAYISDSKAKFLEKIWPGAITVIFHHKGKLSHVLTAGRDTIGIRISNHLFFLELLSQLDFPLVQTSANISGKKPAKNLKEIQEYFSGGEFKPDLIIDEGELAGSPSVIADYTKENLRLVRSGWISKTELDLMFSRP